MPITDTSKKVRKITVGGEVMPLYNGKYNIEAVLNEDGTQTLNIFDWDYEPPPTFDPVFANNTPAQISYVSGEIEKNGYTSAQVAEIYGWNLGDTHDITLTNSEVIQVRIIGFNHDTLSSDHTSRAGITLDMVNCLATLYKMNDTATNAGGYFGSKFVTQDLPTIYDLLPDEWKVIIKPVDKKAANGGSTNYTETITQSCNIFLPAEVEVFDTVSLAQDGANEGSQYEYWVGKANTDRIKKYDKDGDGVADTSTFWRLRSTFSDTRSFCCIRVSSFTTSGDIASDYATMSRGVAFGFCV